MSQTSNEKQFKIPFLVTIPHSGEKIPDLTPWLKNLPEEILMSDVDRFVDVLYKPALQALQIPYQIPEDVDQASVVGAVKKAGTHPDGYHWVMTKGEVQLMTAPMSQLDHQKLTELIYEPFHQGVRNYYELFKKHHFKTTYHLDAHSMPSLGTRMHKDPGEYRADIVVSDCSGKSCSSEFKDLVIAAYVKAGFKVGYNWPYLGGRVTEHYGKPAQNQHAIQVELNRALYMDEKTKKIKPEAEQVKSKIQVALTYIKSELPKLLG